MCLDDAIIQRALLILDCFTSKQEIRDTDYSLVHIACTVLYMSAKYDNRVEIDFYTFFAYLMQLETCAHLLSNWDSLESSDIEWQPLMFNKIE